MNKWLIVFTLGFSTLAVAEEEECHEPKNHCRALELYDQARAKNKQGQWREAFGLAEQAIQEVDKEGYLDYQVLCLSLEDEGYVSDLVFVPCDRFSPYSPNGLTKLIKNNHPPQPYVFVSYGLQDNGWKVTDYQAPAKVKQFVVGNGGETSMQNLELTLIDNAGARISADTAQVKAGLQWQQNVSNADFGRSFEVRLNEKDGFGVNQTSSNNKYQ